MQVIGKRAEEHVDFNSIISLVVDGPSFELHGLEIAEGLLLRWNEISYRILG